MSDTPTLHDIASAAERLGVTQRWMRRAVAERRVPFVKVGRYVRFAEEDLQAYIDTQRVPARDAA